jgi:hypothetical protein
MSSPQTRSSFRLPGVAGVARCVLLIALLALPIHVFAQQADSTEPVFGIGDDEFLIGGWNLPPPPDVTDPLLRAQGSIQWARQMGVNVFRLPSDYYWSAAGPGHYRNVDSLISAADTTDDIRFFITNPAVGDVASWGREARFYLIPDSVPYKHWQCKFLYLNEGATQTAVAELDDWAARAKERVYSRTTVAVNTRIADSIVIDWLPSRTSWWSMVQSDTSWCMVPEPEQQRRPERFLGEFWSVHDKGGREQWGDTNYVAVTGHLINEQPPSDPDSTVLWIDVFYDVGRDEAYFENGVRDTATTNISQYCTTLVVRYRDVERQAGETWDQYQVASLPFSTRWCTPTFGGPLHPSAGVSRRINLRVRYAGNATVAIRSIALRDSIAHAVLTENASGLALRDAMRSVLHDRIAPGGIIRRSIIGIAAGGEQSPVQATSVERVHRWLHEVIYRLADRRNANRPDTLNLWLEGLYRENVFHQATNTDTSGRMTTLAPEHTVPQDRKDPGSAWTVGGSQYDRGAIFEHNGGKFMLSELIVHPDSVERFERQVQLRHLQQYLPGESELFPFQTQVARAARLARDEHKRLIVVPFVSSNIWIRQSRMLGDAFHNSPDSMGCDRILEPAEIRSAANIAISMGATGLFWQILSYPMNFLKLDNGTGLPFGYLLDWPISGGTTADMTQDRVLGFQITTQDGAHAYTMPDTFWTGWRVRSDAVREYNHWLRRVGAELMKLRWRDAYSIHAQRSIPYRHWYPGCPAADVAYATSARPLPANEIISHVNTRSLAGELDPDSATYVELGLFDVKPGRWRADANSAWQPDAMMDTHFVWCANRRVFEPTSDIVDSARRASMIALAGTRTIELKLNLMNKGQFVFCHVEEIEADTARLPGATAPRAALDTVLAADSVIRLTLGSGRASLLRITYDEWQREIIPARVEYTNQRKIVWDPDQRRYHAVYRRPDTANSRFDQVCYRRSKVMDTVNRSIFWEREILLSGPRSTMDSMVFNRHPALTIRRVPGIPRTVVTVVWTAHRTPVPYPAHQVLLRVGASPDGPQQFDTSSFIEVVDSAFYGHPTNQWGTPVVARLDGADVIAWSDSLDGIKARARVIPNPAVGGGIWWKAAPTYTDSIHLSSMFGWSGDDTRGRWPAVPTFAHITSRDSNVALVWEQPDWSAPAPMRPAFICYQRLQHTLAGGNDTLVALDSSLALANNEPGIHRHPSISQDQDALHRVQEVIVWETVASPISGGPANFVTVRSVFFDILSGKPEFRNWSMSRFRLNGLDWLYPTVASVTYRDSNGTVEATSTIANRARPKPASPITVYETGFQWADDKLTPSRAYTHGGHWHASSETPTMQPRNHALLYENDTSANPNLLTSRQFFLGRGRPLGYTAEGRVLAMRLFGAPGVGLSFSMADPWAATADTSFPITMGKRDSTLRIIGALSGATGLLRTRMFDAGDSTVIGISLSAAFRGDTTGYSGTAMTYAVELIDSATNQRVHLLDSSVITTVTSSRVRNIVDTLDLVSSRYYIRAVIDTVGVTVPVPANDSRYAIGEIQIDIVDTLPLYRRRRLPDRGGSDLRITAHPNPAIDATEARFTVGVAGRVRVIVSDHDGRFARTLLDEWMEPGRYALDIDTSTLVRGRYVVQVHAGDEVGLVKVLVRR